MEGKNVILHIFMYNVISDFSVATPASEGRVKLFTLKKEKDPEEHAETTGVEGGRVKKQHQKRRGSG